jgi:hypothetical protein
VESFQLTAEDARAANHDALRRASANGHLGVALWLVSHFQLPISDVVEVFRGR